MKNSTLRHAARITAIAACLSISISACKKPVTEAAPPAAAPAPGNTAETSAPASAPATVTAAPPPDAAPTPFDFNSIPDHVGTVAPFPYITYPVKVGAAFQNTELVSSDRAYVILGKSLYPVDGRIAMRTFYNSDAGMSALEVRRNYESALQALGAIKVNAVAPEDKRIVASSADEHAMRTKMLRIPELNMSYDVYLVRQGSARHWVVVMINDRSTRLLSIQEQEFVPSINYAGQAGQNVTASGAPASTPQPLNLKAVPVNSGPLPPFPYLAYPPKVGDGFQRSTAASFDAVSFIVGDKLRVVEGQVATLAFDNRDADMGQAALRRNYEAAIKGLGGVKVNTAAPELPALVAASGNEQAMREKQLRIPRTNMSYDSYLVRTPEKNIWIALMFGDDSTSMVIVDEKAMQQSVALVTADTMRRELAARGRIALYINFDTDKASIRSDGKPVVDEIAQLLKTDAKLKLSIEGHTDNSGNEQHNLDLSRQRADAVVHALVGSGIDAARLQAAGRGAGKPLADNKDEAGRAKNRRVELVKL